ncbi:hypothetical protein [Lysinibacillus sp. OL1]|uniref:hypothetical protein n=1 Tax=Lysinibacillus sp. OL1 TaxID=2517243 RepID=UPI00187D4877|nr:hypothetical protein [Lysinibacillus sp. OL1]
MLTTNFNFHLRTVAKSLWVSQNGENLEIVTDSDNYVKLTKQDSENLYEVLIGEKLIK